MPRNIILGHCFLSEDDIKLASLIPNIQDIELDSLESVAPLSKGDYTVKRVDNCLDIFQNGKDKDFHAFLSKLLSWTSERSKRAGLHLTARSGRIYTLRKPAIWFDNICGNSEVREWLQRQIEDGNEVHFVVGLHTLFDAATAEGLALTSNNGGDFSIPLDAISSVSGYPSINPGISANVRHGYSRLNRCTAPGEQIFAIRTKKLEFRFWEKKDVQNARLEKNSHWVISSDNRGSDDDFSEIVEVSLGSLSDNDEDTGQDFEGFKNDDTQFYILSQGGHKASLYN